MLHVMLIVTMTISITGIIVVGIGHSGVVVSMHVCICKVCPLLFIGQYIEYTYMGGFGIMQKTPEKVNNATVLKLALK